MTAHIRARWFTKSASIEYIILFGILVLAAYLRLHNVADNPGWYSDEGTHLSIAQNLQQGRVQYLAITESFLLFARLPLFEYILSGTIAIFGSSMATLRGLTAAFGILSVLTLYYVVKRIEANVYLALLAAFLFAIYPQAVLYSRFGFSYNLLVPLVLLLTFGLAEYLRNGQKWALLLAAVCVGIGLISDLIIGSLFLALIVVVIYKNPRDLLWSGPITVMPFGLYALLMLITVPEAFLFDLSYTLSRLGGTSLISQIQNAVQNYTILLSQDFWIPAGIIGLFLLPSPYLRFTSLFIFFSFIFLTGRTAALHSLSAYYTIPILPLPALGAAALICIAVPKMWVMLKTSLEFISYEKLQRGIAGMVIGLIVGLPFAFTLMLLLQYTQGQFPTAIDPFLIKPQDAREVAEYIHGHSEDMDIVIASPGIAWMLNTRTADFQTSVAADGIATVHLPGNLPPQRFAFNPQIHSARYVIVDNLWRNWGVIHIPEVASMLDQLSDWALVFQSGELSVYETPF